MVSATKAGTTTTYAINALGQRVKKTTSGSSRYFVYDEAGHLLGEYNNAGTLIQETMWLGDTPVATIRPNGGDVSMFYVHADHLDTPRRVSRPSDHVVVWRWDGDPFGTAAANEDPDGDSTVFAYELRFPGQYRDQETGLNYNYFRDYDPSTGRYIQSDPAGLQYSLNTYAYLDGNPLDSVDPLGLGRATATGQMIGKFCGTGWNFHFVSDSYRGSVSFSASCKRHDSCYETCGNSKAKCDTQFGDDLKNECMEAFKRGALWSRMIFDCFQRAALYQSAVERGGGEAYRRAQQKCKCSQ